MVQLVIGHVADAHGIRGEVSVAVRTDEPEVRFAVGSTVHTQPSAAGPLTVRSTRWHAHRLLVRFAEVTDRSAAERLRDTSLVLDSEELAPTRRQGEWGDHELIGLTVVDRTSGAGDAGAVGVVEDVLHLPSQELLVVRLSTGAEALVPFVGTIVPEVDVAAGRVVIEPPPGLIDLPARREEDD